jgi:hypothetical protein
MTRFKSILIFMGLFGAMHLQAQVGSMSWITLTGGMNSIWIANQNNYGNPEMPYATKWGFSGALGFSSYVNSRNGYSIAIGMSRAGQNYRGEVSQSDATREVTLAYMHIPLLYVLQIKSFGNPVYVEMGPQFGFLLTASQYFHREASEVGLPAAQYLPEGDLDVKSWFNPIDFQGMFRITKSFPLEGSKHLRAKVGFETAVSLTDINKIAYRLENMHGVYKASRNFYGGLSVSLMYRPHR